MSSKAPVGTAPTNAPVRRLGLLTETVHAVVYFAPEAQDAYAALGLKGYWRGYFASRAAALGPTGGEVVAALFADFSPSFVARAVPAVWDTASPEAVLSARTAAAGAALRRMLPGRDEQLRAAGGATAQAMAALDVAGRPLAAAHRAAARPDDPAAALWHDCTVLREHRGDGHVAAVTAAGLAWPVPHLLARERVDARQRDLRGWSDAEWSAAAAVAGRLPQGTAERLEAATDAAAAAAYAAVDADELTELLGPVAGVIQRSGDIPFPNAMGLPRITAT